jgi:hypothetical protein
MIKTHNKHIIREWEGKYFVDGSREFKTEWEARQYIDTVLSKQKKYSAGGGGGGIINLDHNQIQDYEVRQAFRNDE